MDALNIAAAGATSSYDRAARAAERIAASRGEDMRARIALEAARDEAAANAEAMRAARAMDEELARAVGSRVDLRA